MVCCSNVPNEPTSHHLCLLQIYPHGPKTACASLKQTQVFTKATVEQVQVITTVASMHTLHMIRVPMRIHTSILTTGWKMSVWMVDVLDSLFLSQIMSTGPVLFRKVVPKAWMIVTCVEEHMLDTSLNESNSIYSQLCYKAQYKHNWINGSECVITCTSLGDLTMMQTR